MHKMQRIALFRQYSETKRERERESASEGERGRERRERDSHYLGRVVVEGFLHVCDISSAKRCSVHTTCRME